MKSINYRLWLQNFLTTLLPNYIIVSYSVKPLMEFNISLINKFGVEPSGIVLAVVLIIATFVIPSLINNIRWFKKENILYKENDRLKRMLFGISYVVDVKKNRFHSSKNKDALINSSDFFKEITQPVLQISSICTSITNLMHSITGSTDVKLSLLTCINGEIASYLYLSEESPSVEIGDLNRRSTAKESISKHKMCLIENIEKRDKRKEIFFESPHNRIKSIITYPVSCGGKVLFVISATSKSEGLFKRKDVKQYEHIFEEFSKRILLESYLLDIKQKCQDI